MTDEGTGNLPAAVRKAYDLLLWLIDHVGKFPQFHRVVVGDCINFMQMPRQAVYAHPPALHWRHSR